MELNVVNKSTKKIKKPLKSIEKISNQQNVNPGFNFTWGSTDKPVQGKVFARKRKANVNNNVKTNINKPTIVANAPTKIIKPVIDKTNNTKTPINKIETINSTQQNSINNESLPNKNINKPDDLNLHIKRKQKKDKVLARKEGTEIKQPKDQKTYSLFNQKAKPIYVDTSGGKSVSEKVFIGGAFNELGIHNHLVSNLEKIEFTKLTNVQGKSIPVVMSGKNTLIRSQTGSGKTLAYAVPIIDALQGITPRLKRTDGVQAIIVVPTRELALQTHELFSKINTFQWVNVGHLCGGENRKSEKDRIRKGINVLIGTPGRLLDHVLHTSALKVDRVRCLVLDEADRLLDMGFRKDIIGLVEALDSSKSDSDYNPMALLKSRNNTEDSEEEICDENAPPLMNTKSKKRQTILLSATLNKGVSELAEFTMKEHTYIDALDHTSNAILDSYVIPDTVKQEFIMTVPKHRLFTLSALLVAKSKQPKAKLFVFMASSQMVEFHHLLFTKYLMKMPVNRGKNKFPMLEDDSDESEDEETVVDTQIYKLHGSMDQKQRKDVFNGFRSATKGILICTDVAARGLDVPEADCIVQYTGPQSDEDYLHRVGRTGRAGKSGSAVIFLTHEEQDYISHLREHRVFLKKRNPEDYLEHLCELMGETEQEQAATALQKRFETAVDKDKELHRVACFAFSTWSRYYNSLPVKLRSIFNYKNANLGHYVTSFALRDTPTSVSKMVRGQVESNVEEPRLNKKLANHKDNPELHRPRREKEKKHRSLSLSTSEFSSGLEPIKKKKKKNY